MKRKAIAGRPLAARVTGFIRGHESSMTLNDPVRLIADALEVVAPGGLLQVTPLPAAAAAGGWISGPLGVSPPLHRRCNSFIKPRTVSKAKRFPGSAPAVTLARRSWRGVALCRNQGLLPLLRRAA